MPVLGDATTAEQFDAVDLRRMWRINSINERAEFLWFPAMLGLWKSLNLMFLRIHFRHARTARADEQLLGFDIVVVAKEPFAFVPHEGGLVREAPGFDQFVRIFGQRKRNPAE